MGLRVHSHSLRFKVYGSGFSGFGCRFSRNPMTWENSCRLASTNVHGTNPKTPEA